MAFKGTGRRTQHALELEVENIGAHLNAYTAREQTVYYAKSFWKDVPTAVDIISNILQNSKLDPQTIDQPLGRTILGPKANILSLQCDDLSSYIKTNYTADRMVLIGTGGVDHAELVKLAEKNFSSLPVSSNPIPLGRLAHLKTTFVGSEVRIHDDEKPTANIAIAVEGVSWSSPHYFPMMVMQTIFGN
ncbi:Metalloenzyme, LuxS/M16 peptidase-like protein [Mycena floridula]|nr:Metalloenzyme, LuxS/M16 peptidase-like protein [Mycena floridula]